MRIAYLTLTMAAAAAAQECRVVPVTPFQPAPKIEEGERALESQTFQAAFGTLAASPGGAPYFVDAVNRIRRVDADGRARTVAGNGTRGDALEPGPAREKAMPPVGQLYFSPSGVLHFTAVQRVWRVVDDRIEPVAGSGRPGFNGEEGPALEVNLGAIVNAAFVPNGDLLVIDGYNRVRRLTADGRIRTVAGSTQPTLAAGRVGDGGPAVEAGLNNPRQVFPFADGSFWIKDLTGRHLRLVDSEGVIRTVNANFDNAINLIPLADGRPGAASANRVYPIRANGIIETGGAPYTPFTGTPLTTDRDGSLYFVGGERPGLRNPLIRLRSGAQTPVASAPVVEVLDGQAPPFGVWYARTNSLVYSTSIEGKTGIAEVRPGQSSRFLVGGGTDIGDPDGKDATAVSIFGVVSFAVDAQNRIIVADASRQRILVVGTDNKISVLKSGGQPVIFAPLGAFGTHQRITADREGNIYWYARGATPTGGVFTADIAAWRRSDGTVRQFTVQGLATMIQLEDGGAAVIAGNATAYRNVYRISPDGLGDLVEPFRFLPLTSVAHWRGQTYFTAANRLFRGGPPYGVETLDLAFLPTGAAFNPSFVMTGADTLLVRLGDGGFYRIENPGACRWLPQPRIDAVVSAGDGGSPDVVSPFQWLTLTGPGLGPTEGQGIVLNGLARAAGQPAPFPSITLGNFSGANPFATLTGTTLPVLSSNDRQMVVQSIGNPSAPSYLLYFTWNGLTLFYPRTLAGRPLNPSLFTEDGAAAATNEDGTRNRAANPAPKGSRLRLLATGLGTHQTGFAIGDFYGPEPPSPAGEVAVTIGGEPAEVLSATGVPGSLGGSFQIEVLVPEGLESGKHPVELTVNGTGPVEPGAAAVVYVR